MMTPTELYQTWQRKLSDAKSALSDFEQRMGTLALTNDPGELATRLTDLRNAVTIAEAAAATAKAAAPDPTVERKRAQVENAKATAAQWKTEAEKWGAIQQELEPRYVEAKQRCVSAIQLLMQHENSVDFYQAELNELIRAAARQPA